MPKPIIFVSHISKEAELAAALKKHLTKDFLGMIDVFVSSDDTSIQLGGKWLDAVDKALKEAEIEIVLCSKDSVYRPWVNFEAGGGWIRGISVVPMCHTDIKPTELPIPLNMLEAIEVSNASGIQKLYSLIANKIGAQSPRDDFDSIVREFKEVEKKYKDDKLANLKDLASLSVNNEIPTIKRITKPKILCASNSQFEEFGFEKDLTTIQNYFPGQVVTARNITVRTLREILTEQQFDILHILAYVAKNGDLVLSNYDPEEKKEQKTNEKISAEGFAKLIEVSNISLVVLATCDSLPLAASLNRKTNLVAAMDVVQIDEIIEWEDCFYGFLSKGFSVAKSFELSKSLHTLPMILIPSIDIAFAPER